MNGKGILIIDFGGQYDQLIARRVRECGVYSEIIDYDRAELARIMELAPEGLIFTGGPRSVYEAGAPSVDPGVFELGIPVLGICYGAQLMAYLLGGSIEHAPLSEYGRTSVSVEEDSELLRDADRLNTCWMSHTDYISSAPEGFRITARSGSCPVAAMEDTGRRLYAVQFHPEVSHTDHGSEFIGRFVSGICGCARDWKMDSFAEEQIEKIREKVGDGRVLLALSGGVDSSVAAALLSRAIGSRLSCVFVDHGLMRKGEADEIEAVFGKDGPYDLDFRRVDASERFFSQLTGVSEPEAKRRIIGEQFIRVFEEEAELLGKPEFLAQGTIYPDVIESGRGKSAVIKSHHNVGGLPERMRFRAIIEPLSTLFKDEVRQLGRELGLPESLVSRQPFPGPGLGVRIVGAVTPEKAGIVREADAIFREEIKKAGLDGSISQYYAALTNTKTVGVKGDFRTYEYAVALRAVITSDFMTAAAADIPWEVLQRVMTRIVNEVGNVNRVFYDITSKPPGTVEIQ